MDDFARWIVFSDDDLLAVNKPAGIASQGGDGLAGRNLVDLSRAYLGHDRVAVLHRIDRNVSGVVLLAKHRGAAQAMSALVASGGLDRRYQAVVKGRVTGDRTLRHYLRKDSRDNRVHLMDAPESNDGQVANVPADHKLAITRVEAIEEVGTLLGVCTIVSVWPITGRSHQIRAQLAAAGFPIVGDPKYGVHSPGLRRPLLHAVQVRFDHPRTEQPMDIVAPVPWTRAELTNLRRARPRGR